MKSLLTVRQNIDLKKRYRFNLALGFGISAAVNILMVGLFVMILPQEIEGEDFFTIGCPGFPGSVSTPISIRNFVPVPDSELFDNVDYDFGCFELRWISESGLDNEVIVGSGAGYYDKQNEILPPPDSLIAFEEAPVSVNSVDPVYPDLARRAGLEADIWIKVLIDTNGKVRDVLIANSSERTAGFEQSAKKAAYSTVWKPAIANGQPVAVWATYKVSFRLK